MTIPNVISLVRLALVPVFLWLTLTDQPEWALTVFVVASASDLVDGFLARVLDQRSKFGAFIDPFADKLLVFAALVTRVAQGGLPWWLLGAILLRDVPMAIGAIIVRRKHLDLPTSPSRIGKYSTFALVVTIVLALAGASPQAPQAIEGYTMTTAFLAALCVLLSMLQYWTRFGYLLFAPERNASSADEEKVSV